MNRLVPGRLWILGLAALGGCGDSGGADMALRDLTMLPPDLTAPPPDLAVPGDLGAGGDLASSAVSPLLSFFITSETGSAKLGGLVGADARCLRLAEAAGVKGKRWAAYLSTSGEGGISARNRIGKGPWHNAKGVKIADDVATLHAPNNNVNKQTALDERGRVVNGRGDTPNQHDILTGSKADGTVNGTSTCANWTSEAGAGMADKATVGHHDREGGGADPMSWNSAHDSAGCSAPALVGTGGAGRFYCFAIGGGDQ